MKKIPLTKNKFAMVDDEDFQFLLGFKWTLLIERRSCYAGTRIDGKAVKMHWLILPTVKPLIVDHIDSNGLNNQRLNLRRVTQTQNARNRRKMSNSKSKFKGVYWDKRLNKWMSSIQIRMKNKKSFYVGRFEKEIDAAKAYDACAKKYFGEYAYLNFPGGNL